jgi:hypothetical protein
MKTNPRFRRALPAVLAIGVLVPFTAPAAAREGERDRKSSAFVELGPGLSWTTNFERTFTPRLNLRLGGGFAFDFEVERTSYEFLAMSDFLLLKGHHQVVVGVGVIGLWDAEYCAHPHSPGLCRDGKSEWIPDGEVGYRYHSKSGFILRVTLARSPNPSTAYTDRRSEHLVLPALSLGWSF